MHKIQIENDIYHLPQNWNELTPKQLEHLVRLSQTDTPVEQMKIHMMLFCLNAHVCRHREIFRDKVKIAIGNVSTVVKFWIRFRKYPLLPTEVFQLADLFGFLVRTRTDKYIRDKVTYSIDPELTCNPYPTIRCRIRKFTGPEDFLYNITFEQFMYMQTYLDAMKSDAAKINYLIACLWHRGKAFDINGLEADAKLLIHLPAAKKMVMYWYVLGCLAALSKDYPRVFSGEGKQTGNVFDAQLRLLDSLAQSDMTKKPEVRKGLLYDALYSMDESVRHQEEVEEKRK